MNSLSKRGYLSLTTRIWPDIFKLDDKVIVVTGAGLIGSKIIKILAEAGAKVIISDIDEQVGERLEDEFKKKNFVDIVFKKSDITKEESVNSIIKYCIKEYNRIDAWVNTAYPQTEDWGDSNITSYSIWKKNVTMHLGGYFISSIKAAETMRKQKYGSIINLSSIYGITAPDFSIYEGTDIKNEIPYAAIKGGINMLTKYIATYYGKYNIRANVIAPGGVFNNQPEPFPSNYKKRVPLNRMATPEDIAGPVLFLISDAASYITGHILVVDGGWTVW